MRSAQGIVAGHEADNSVQNGMRCVGEEQTNFRSTELVLLSNCPDDSSPSEKVMDDIGDFGGKKALA
eukprot:CAMPEP_0172166918 /NCGR_PEP_ID=MMETSP1050-20130122/9273_1 /TAXON_ID=233186 /ORGANISM="Cryptomonas curvata, Strain CCAP979/52" /LENGTH=66 /DNA_ID=CAMNT_0012837631 /DNA_START=788 /DNA_END=990 /DNA_ORIENTATION=+